MDISTYLLETGQTVKDFAPKIKIGPEYLAQIINGIRKPGLDDLCLRIVRASGGHIKLKDLRPDLTQVIEKIRMAENDGESKHGI